MGIHCLRRDRWGSMRKRAVGTVGSKVVTGARGEIEFVGVVLVVVLACIKTPRARARRDTDECRRTQTRGPQACRSVRQ